MVQLGFGEFCFFKFQMNSEKSHKNSPVPVAVQQIYETRQRFSTD